MAALDLDAAEAGFQRTTDGTVGIEEEFAILDPESLDLVPAFDELFEIATGDELLGEHVAGELIISEIEIKSKAGDDFNDAVADQRRARSGLFALAQAQGYRLGSTGTHPWADYREQVFVDTEHYRRVTGELQYVARRNNTFALHVHVGVSGADRAVRVCDRLRPVLPTLLAASVNSPFLEGHDSGLRSARTQTFTRSFPRCGIPDAFGSWAAYREYLELLVATGSIVEATQVWWSIRPHLVFGTVEVRICDAQMTAEESEALAGLIVACVLQAARDEDEGRPMPDVPPRLVEENLWRAIRWGDEGELIDFASGRSRPARRAVDELQEWTEAVRSEWSIDTALPERTGARRQLDRFEDGESLRDVYASTVALTGESYGGDAPTEDSE
ncbi:MAG: YbdK family carboxylate-amine ligase [Solirubrobacterales bacterium]